MRIAAYGPALIKRGVVYVYSLRFEARRALPQAVMTTGQAGDGQDLVTIGAAIDLAGTEDDPENPQASLQLDFL